MSTTQSNLQNGDVNVANRLIDLLYVANLKEMCLTEKV